MNGFLFEAHWSSRKMARISQRAEVRRLVRQGRKISCGPTVSRARGAELSVCGELGLILATFRNAAHFKPFAHGRLSASESFCYL